ncbi:hypothetical protein MJO29_009068 [Puccinia striiformis f. sp. tritici]|nr:hypothetical protein Pst134EB_018774 [Puccinia striiformis f. sp. tritici]KAI7950393.1 hypothetical protein MJO29_009067 [Puccinia striiformis f. sp. tritici]KAI7950394.1 hypothetical protein MJO29_009068 [Puccinia striiformis f. sp. tritici]
MRVKMSKFLNIYRRICIVHWVGLAVFIFSTIGSTNQSPTNAVARRGPPPGPKPAMGWNSFWPFGCGKHVKEHKLREQADLLAEKGLNTAGYSTFIVECGWEDWVNKDGSPKHMKKAFKHGVRPFSDYLNTKGLHLGLSSWAGKQICRRDVDDNFYDGRDGSKDLKLYITKLVEWGMVYFSHRPCGTAWPSRLQSPDRAAQLNNRYIAMEDAIRDSGAKIFYSTGQWGTAPDSTNQLRANSWTVAAETRDNWYSFIKTLNELVPVASKTRLGSFADLGFLQLGDNKLTGTEKLTQFAFWAAAKSPLIFSTDLWKLDQFSIDMLKNPGPIAVNQDDLGKSITFKRRYSLDKDIWSGPLSDGSTVAVIINWEDNTSQKVINLADLGFASAHLYEVWTGRDLGPVKGTYTTTVGGHGALFLKLTETTPAPKPKFKRFPAEMADAMGTARLKEVTPKLKAMSQIGPDGKGGVRWSNIPGGQTEGDVLVSIDYINAYLPDNTKYYYKPSWEIVSVGTHEDPNLAFRRTVITVNDTKKVIVDFPISGLLWEDVHEGFLVSLPLLPGDSNKILIEGVGDWAPDFVSLSVEQKPEQAS